jgi:hypothetical protein
VYRDRIPPDRHAVHSEHGEPLFVGPGYRDRVIEILMEALVPKLV